jgi:hypothetical protein
MTVARHYYTVYGSWERPKNPEGLDTADGSHASRAQSHRQCHMAYQESPVEPTLESFRKMDRPRFYQADDRINSEAKTHRTSPIIKCCGTGLLRCAVYRQAQTR